MFSFRSLVYFLVLSAISAIGIGYILSSDAKVCRAVAGRPWDVFWLALLAGPAGTLLLGGLDYIFHPNVVILTIGAALVGITFVVMGAAVVVGLIATCRRSRRKALLVAIVAYIWLFGAGVMGGRGSESVAEFVLMPFGAVAWLALMALCAERFARWRAPTRDAIGPGD